jgi:hypothetical protein
MTSNGHMGTTNDRWATLVRRAALSMIAAVAVNVAHAGSTNPPSPAVTPCDNSLSDRFAPGCKDDAAVGDPDGLSAADPDEAGARKHDALDDRPKQIETMNQQLRMEKRRRDSLLHLYPDEAAHDAARIHDLEEMDKPIRAAEDRIEDLRRERRRLSEATGLYAGKRLPSALKEQSQRVDIALQEARATLKDCREERVLVGKTYDEELIVLRKLWAAQAKI